MLHLADDCRRRKLAHRGVAVSANTTILTAVCSTEPCYTCADTNIQRMSFEQYCCSPPSHPELSPG